MAGKAYTMREMKGIVEYLYERKAYGELKGRKMWMEFANSDKTARSWQSLKETFLKRILPDIHNPYYKLNMNQVRSFREGFDVAEREKNNRLEFRTAGKDSNAEDQNGLSTAMTDKEVPTTSHEKEEQTNINNEPPIITIDDEMEKVTGEDIKAAKIPSRSRSSTETVVLEYENAEDVQRVLESPINDTETKSKSLKEMLTFEYTAPLTPLVRDLLNDFETESETSDSEPRLKIAEDLPKTNNTESEAVLEDVLEDIKVENVPFENDMTIIDADSIIEIHDTDNFNSTEINDNNMDSTEINKNLNEEQIGTKSDKPDKNKELNPQSDVNEHNNNNEKKHENDNQINQLADGITNTEPDPKETIELVPAESNATIFEKSLDAGENSIDCNCIANSENSIQIPTLDSLLPNNQECLDNSKKETQNAKHDKTEEITEKAKHDKTRDVADNAQSKKNRLGKRSSSTDNRKGKKQKLSDMNTKEINNDEASISVLDIVDSTLPTINLEEKALNENTGIIAVSSDFPTNDTEELFNIFAKQLSENVTKPSTNTKKYVPNTAVNQEINTTVVEDIEDKNLCLLSVSLFDEQFKNSKYSDSDSNDATKQKQNMDISRDVTDKLNKTNDIPQKSKYKKDAEVTQKANDKKDAKVSQKANDKKDAELTQKAKDKKDAEVTQKAIDKKNAEVTEKAKYKKDAEVTQKAKDMKDAEVIMAKEITAVDNNKEADSNLDSSADFEPQNQRVVNKNVNAAVNLQRERALANVFGFAHGYVASNNRKRQLSHRRRSHYHRRRNSKNVDSNSSEWTSESDSESYVSPPHGSRRNVQTKKYLKPKSSRILQDPEEGMLYVIFGKNIYPLVKNGKHVKKFLTYRPDSGSDEEESFWRQKYIEEKKRVEEVRKLLKDSHKNNAAQITESTLASTSQNNTKFSKETCSPQMAANNRNGKDYATAPEVENKTEAKDNKMTLKIAGKNGLEYCLEGAWNQISNAMPQVVRMLQSETDTDSGNRMPINGTGDQHKAIVQVEDTSGVSTPVVATVVDAEVHAKVNAMETEIFNEIKSLEAQQMEKEVKQTDTDSTNVTKRKPGRPRKESSSSAVPKSPSKRTRTSNTSSTDTKQEPKTKRKAKPKLNIPEANQDENEQQPKMAELDTNAEQKELTPKSSKKVAEKQKDIGKKVPLRRSSSRLSKRDTSEHNSSLGDKVAVGTRVSARMVTTPKKYDTDSSVSDVKFRPTTSKDTIDPLNLEDDNVRYMFPPENTYKKPAGNKNRSLLETNIVLPQESGNSVNSTQGYQDSDPSPLKICWPKRKRKASFTARNKYMNKRSTRRRSCPVLTEKPSSDFNNSSYFIPVRSSMLSLNSEVYRSDSCRLLMPKQKQSFKIMNRIDENNTALPEFDPNIRHFNSVSKDTQKCSDNSGFSRELGSSSSISLPPSPEISVVENMSISREMIKDANHPTINEAQLNMNSLIMDYSEYMMSNLDVSIPLMNQTCKLRKTTDEVASAQNFTVTDSMKLKDCTVNLTLSDTLDRRLRELLLESTKKPTQTDNKETLMEVDQSIVTAKKTRVRKQKANMRMDVDESQITTKKTRAKKRSSTPQKKKAIPKSKARHDPIIEEEHVELCSAGRKSCPPVMTFIPVDENANDSSDITLNHVKINVKNKKEIIKVKIQKPKEKRQSKRNFRAKSVENGSVGSNFTDSGIKDTERTSLVLEDGSVDLIHNHSTTCLLANECMGSGSIEFVKNSPISIISLSSEESGPNLSEDTSINLDNIATEARTSQVFTSLETRYNSSLACNSSILTEDLSNSPPKQPTKWYLFDEDITSPESTSNFASCGSNLKQIFPIACAVPNLSTISEISKENEDSRKTSGGSQNGCFHNLF